ncbi:hypothetical protein FRC04_002798 [Tulasnella sp. 424]|nr:hypothetical protein FRC04_002798 [Tulasnella sp. 424]
MQGAVWNMLPMVIKNVTGLERLELVSACLSFSLLKTLTGSSTLRSLKIRSCGSSKGLGPLVSHLQDKDVCDVIEVLRLNVVQLELDYTSWIPSEIHPEIPFLAFLPALQTLALCGKSFRAVTQLPKTLSPPPLRHLTITDNQTYSVNKEDVLSYFARCSKLKTLDVDDSIQTSALAQGDIPANLPDLMEYKGPAELLTLLHTPNLRFALATGFDWDGGAWIRSLFTASPTLQSLVIELAAGAEDPAWVEQAASKWSLLWRSTARFSLVIRTAPLGEWIFSAKGGRTDGGDLFIEYFRQR